MLPNTIDLFAKAKSELSDQLDHWQIWMKSGRYNHLHGYFKIYSQKPQQCAGQQSQSSHDIFGQNKSVFSLTWILVQDGFQRDPLLFYSNVRFDPDLTFWWQILLGGLRMYLDFLSFEFFAIRNSERSDRLAYRKKNKNDWVIFDCKDLSLILLAHEAYTGTERPLEKTAKV